MLRRVRELIGCAIGAADGELGRVHDVYVEDWRWVVQYLAVETGRWTAGRHVLICPASVERIAWRHRRVEVALTRQLVRDSPDVDTHKPIERQHEIALYEYYGFPYYWTTERRGGITGTERGAEADSEADDRHLHSA